ncbi:MAG TPA: hypothetical protein PK413_07765 [Thermoanaerobaculia bacterium]|nr:hypothetical protein [Thermoanaerobaculia bacterium]
MTARFSWVVLGALLAALLVAAASFDRRSWPALVGDEATYLMQAESLAFDFDLRYERRDFDRFRQHWGRLPEGLILQSPDRGAHFTFGKPASYSLYLAPFVRISPTRGPSVANALLLAAAALCSAFTLRHTVGRAAPLWVAVFVFASVAFTQVFWAHMDLFLMCTGALALALANLPEAQTAGALPEIWGEPAPAGRRPWRWAATGAMLAVAAAARPQYGALFLPGLLAVPKSERRSGWMALGLGAATVGLVAVAGSYFWNGSWTPYGGERLGFYSYTGFPLVDLKESWPSLVASRGRGSWIAPGHLLPYGFDAHLSAYNALYLLLGRNVGLLPYYLPLVLGLLAYRPGRGRWALPLAALAATAVFVAIRPFNFWGGGAAGPARLSARCATQRHDPGAD